MERPTRKKSETLAELDALIEKVRERLSKVPEYRNLRALEQARQVIFAASQPTLVDDVTGEELVLVPTGRTYPRGHPSQTEASKMALEQAGEPLQIGPLVERVRALGGVVGGKNPNVNLGSTLSKDEDFRSIKWKGEPAWWFTNRPLPGREPREYRDSDREAAE